MKTFLLTLKLGCFSSQVLWIQARDYAWQVIILCLLDQLCWLLFGFKLVFASVSIEALVLEVKCLSEMDVFLCTKVCGINVLKTLQPPTRFEK